MKKPSLSTLYKKAWKFMSIFIRKRDKGKCITCGDKRHWKEQDAGHFVHKRCLSFDERNINAQCSRCNRYLHGNLGVYAIEIDKKFGAGTAEGLILLGKQTKKFRRKELEDIIVKYKS